MGVSILFLISCVITARFLEKRKMRAAAVLYSVFFIVALSVLVLALDFPPTDIALSNILGADTYNELHLFMLGVLNMSFYGVSMISVIGLTFAVLLAVVIIETTKTVVRSFIVKTPSRKFRKVYFRFACLVRNLYLPKRINLLYCRMLD